MTDYYEAGNPGTGAVILSNMLKMAVRWGYIDAGKNGKRSVLWPALESAPICGLFSNRYTHNGGQSFENLYHDRSGGRRWSA